jgi:outer membrane protein assembly factor BamB
METSTMPVAGSGAPSRRFGGKRFAIGFVALLLTAVTVGLIAFFSLRIPTGPIVTRGARLPDGGILVVREGNGDTRHVFLVRLDVDGNARWWNGLFGEVPDFAPIAYGGLAIVRADSGRGMAETYAFDLEDGEFRWRADHPGGTASRLGNGAIAPATEGVIVELWEGRPGIVIARSLSDGGERWRTTLPRSDSAWTLDIEGGTTIVVRSGILERRLAVVDGAQAPN